MSLKTLSDGETVGDEGTDQWGENLLEENVFSAWDNTSVKYKIEKDTLRWNFAFEDASGNREEFYDLDLNYHSTFL